MGDRIHAVLRLAFRLAAILNLWDAMRRFRRTFTKSLIPLAAAAGFSGLLTLTGCASAHPVPLGARQSPPPAGARRATLSDVLDRQNVAAETRLAQRFGAGAAARPLSRVDSAPPPLPRR